MFEEQKLIESLTPWQQAAVGTAVVARMYPNYALFCELTAFCDPTKFQSILALVWEYASGVNDKVDFERQQLKLDVITPNPDDYDMYGVWPALDAVTGLATLLGFCRHSDISELSAVFKLSRSTISQYVELLDERGEGKDEQSGGHPLLAEDKSFLVQVINQIQLGTDQQGRKQAVKALRLMVAELTESNIGLSV